MNIEELEQIKQDLKAVYNVMYNFDDMLCDDMQERVNRIEKVVTAYEKEKRLAEANLKDSEEFQDNMCNHRCILNLEVEELKQELGKEKEKNKKLSQQNEDMKALFNIQASIAKELDFNTNEKMVKFKDEYYVPDTMAINSNIGEPKTIELSYISATKYLTKFDEEE